MKFLIMILVLTGAGMATAGDPGSLSELAEIEAANTAFSDEVWRELLPVLESDPDCDPDSAERQFDCVSGFGISACCNTRWIGDWRLRCCTVCSSSGCERSCTVGYGR